MRFETGKARFGGKTDAQYPTARWSGTIPKARERIVFPLKNAAITSLCG